MIMIPTINDNYQNQNNLIHKFIASMSHKSLGELVFLPPWRAGIPCKLIQS